MRNAKLKNIWDVLYPVVLYVVVSDCICMLLSLALGEHTVSPMMLQILTVILSSPPVIYLYVSDRKGQKFLSDGSEGRKDSLRINLLRINLLRILVVCIVAACLSVSLNNLILATKLEEQSAAYRRVNASFFSSTFGVELLGTSLVTPILEEILYRGIVYERLKRCGKIRTAVFLSALIFGAMHFNLVQFLYAGLIGVFLAVVYETEGTILVPMLAHAVANAVAVARVETGFLSGFSEKNPFFLPLSLLLLGISIIMTWYLIRGRLFEKQLKDN